MAGDYGKKQFNVYLPPELIRDLKHYAVDVDQSLSQVVEDALTAWLSLHGRAQASERRSGEQLSRSRGE
jgi:hypothetical protein